MTNVQQMSERELALAKWNQAVRNTILFVVIAFVVVLVGRIVGVIGTLGVYGLVALAALDFLHTAFTVVIPTILLLAGALFGQAEGVDVPWMVAGTAIAVAELAVFLGIVVWVNSVLNVI